jgi:hypothetical protein
VSLVLSGAVLLIAAGCDDRKSGTVSGTVKFDDTLLEEGSITFISMDGKGGTPGGPIKNGQYSVAAVPTGTMKVVIHGVKELGNVPMYDAPNSPTRRKVTELLPAKYSDTNASELRLDVVSGVNENKDFDLKSK